MTLARWLFLDFDGVLHGVFPRKDRSDAQNAHWAFLPAVAEVLRRHPAVGIVISSSWRTQRSLDELRALFPPDIASRIAGVTPLSETPYGPGGRQAEVQAWLATHGHAEDTWVALDDVPDLFEPGACVVVTPDGFFEAEAHALDAALRHPQNWAHEHPLPERTVALWVPGA